MSLHFLLGRRTRAARRMPLVQRQRSSAAAATMISSGMLLSRRSTSASSRSLVSSSPRKPQPCDLFSPIQNSVACRFFHDNPHDDERGRPRRSSPPTTGDRTTGVITVARPKGKETGYCYGCGADLVRTDDAAMAGTVSTFSGKKNNYWQAHQRFLKKAKLKNWALCGRCRSLKQRQEQQQGNDDDDDDDAALQALAPDHAMTQIFREQVSELRRTVREAVVVLCVDAVNVHGSLLRTIRNYVGGHPILLAVTRCDLLPKYVWERWEREVGQHGGGNDYDDDDDDDNHRPAVLEAVERVYAERAAAVQPAAVYLCSEEREVRSKTGGLRRLAQDLWQHLNGRDVYVVGAANLGKSTLTDLLIAGFLHQGDRLGL